MIEIHATEIATYGHRKLMRVTKPGQKKARTKDGEVDVPFSAGDVIVTDATGHVLVEPISLATGCAIASAILEGHERVVTAPGLQLKIAAVILGFAVSQPEPLEPEPASTAMQPGSAGGSCG